MDAEQPENLLSRGEPSDALEGARLDCAERRLYTRYGVEEEATLLLVSHGLSLRCHILDLSLEGCRLALLEPYAVAKGTRVEVTFKVNGVAFRFAGVLQWTGEGRMVGVHFVEIVPRRSELLSEVLSELRRVVEASAAEEAAERVAAETEAVEAFMREAGEETRERAPRQGEALVRKAGQPAKPKSHEPAGPSSIERRAEPGQEGARRPHGQPQSQPLDKRDRRAHERRSVDTSATVFLVKCGSKLRGHILDLSMSGCRFRCDERFPVGIYTRVETEFHLEGLPFLLGGVIQAIHDRHSVGIRFLDMSQRKREQVEQLIAEIARAEAGKLASTGPPEGIRSDAMLPGAGVSG